MTYGASPQAEKHAKKQGSSDPGGDEDEDEDTEDPLAEELAAEAPSEEEGAADQEEEEAPERDYEGQLRAAFGSPVGCLKPRERGSGTPEEIVISLQAVVVKNGQVSRGDATSATLDREELRCLRQQLEGAHLPGDVEEAPRSVRTTITLKMRPSKAH